MALVDAALRMILAKGEAMTLRRIATGIAPVDVTVKGRISMASVAAPADMVQQQQREIRITNSEIATAAWPGPPRKNDRVLVGSTSYTVEAVSTEKVGASIALHVLTVRG